MARSIQHPGIKRGRKAGTRVIDKDMQRCAERIWNAISKYITVDKDGIFADPDWPHLWSKK